MTGHHDCAAGMNEAEGKTHASPDWVLLECWQQGQQGAGEELVKRYLGLLTRFFQNKVSDREDVCDLVSDTMLACTRGQQRIRRAKSFRSYIFGIACNQLRRYYQKQTKRSLERDDFEQCCVAELDKPSQGSELVRKEQTHITVHGLRSLPLPYQIVLELALFEEMSGRQIGEMLDLPTATVHTRLRRGKAHLATAVARLSANPDQWSATVTDLEGWAQQLRESGEIRR